MSDPNYPDSVNPADPSAPWNAEDPKAGIYSVTITVRIEAFDDDDAQFQASKWASVIGDVEAISSEFIEELE